MAGIGGLQNSTNLFTQHGWAIDADTNTALTQEGVFLTGQRQIGQGLVTAHVKRADNHRPVFAHDRQNAFVGAHLLSQ